jgi:hypothetical protein
MQPNQQTCFATDDIRTDYQFISHEPHVEKNASSSKVLPGAQCVHLSTRHIQSPALVLFDQFPHADTRKQSFSKPPTGFSTRVIRLSSIDRPSLYIEWFPLEG